MTAGSKILVLCFTLLLASQGLVNAQELTPEEQARQFNEVAVQDFTNGNYEDALGKFKKAHDLNPKEAIIKRNIARCYAHIALRYFEQRKFHEAARDYKLAEDYDPANSNYGFFRGRALLENNKNEDAIQVFSDHLRRFSNHAASYRLQGKAYYNLNRSEKAKEAFKSALKLNPKDEVAKSWLKKLSKESSAEKTLADDFSTLHFNIKFDGAADGTLGSKLGRILERAYENVGREFGMYPEGTIAVVIYPTKSFARVTGVYGWVGALYDGKIRIPGRSVTKLTDAQVEKIIHHEYCHALIARLAGRKCPTWLHEGLAQILERGDTAMARKLVGQNPVALKSLKGSFVRVKNAKQVRKLYASSLLFTEYLRNQSAGLWVFKEILESLGKGEALDAVFKDRFGSDLATLYDDWKRSL